MVSKIMVAVDFEPHSEKVIDEAVEFARAFGAHMRLIHIVDMPPELPVCGPPGELEKTLARAQSQLNEWRARLTITCDCEIRRGPIGETLVEAAVEYGAHLVVMGTHGRRGLSKAIMGSVAEYVVRRAPCPVLCLRVQSTPIEKSGHGRGRHRN